MKVLTPEQYRQEAAMRIIATVAKDLAGGDVKDAGTKTFDGVVTELRVAEIIGREGAYVKARKDAFASLARCGVN